MSNFALRHHLRELKARGYVYTAHFNQKEVWLTKKGWNAIKALPAASARSASSRSSFTETSCPSQLTGAPLRRRKASSSPSCQNMSQCCGSPTPARISAIRRASQSANPKGSTNKKYEKSDPENAEASHPDHQLAGLPDSGHEENRHGLRPRQSLARHRARGQAGRKPGVSGLPHCRWTHPVREHA